MKLAILCISLGIMFFTFMLFSEEHRIGLYSCGICSLVLALIACYQRDDSD